jgi:aryl-alcohol dehydrogenase-like predicted oxidoreductase
MTSVLMGPRTMQQMEDCVKAVENVSFTDEELSAILAE